MTVTTSLSDFARSAAIDESHSIVYTSRGNGCGSPWFLYVQELINDVRNPLNGDTPLVVVSQDDDPEAWTLATQAMRDVLEDSSERPTFVALAPIDDNGSQQIFAF